MFFSNERAKQSPKAEVKLPKDIRSLFASPEETEARYERLHDRTLVTRLQAATEFEALLTTQPPRWFGGEAPLADTDEVNKLLPYVRRVFQDSSATVEELDIAIRLGVATLLHHRESDARDMANDLFNVVAFNRFKEEYEDAVTSALDALALLSATHPAHTLPAIARLIEEVDPADDIDSVFAAFLTLAALASTESTITSVRPWIERGLRSENSDVLLAALQALAIVRERLGELKEPSLLADAQRASPSVAAHNRKPIAALMRALETNEVPDEELTLDFSSSRRGRVVEIVVVGLYHQLVLHTLREFVKSGLQWYISAVPNVAEAIGVDSADIAQRSVTDMDNRAMEYDRQQRTVDRERGRRDARDAKSRSHEAGDE